MLTIILPTFNAEGDITECLSSIADVVGDRLGQDIHVWIQDGNSSDDTVSRANALQLPGLRISVETDHGIYDAMNRAISAVDADWVYFMGADDRLLPDFLPAVDSLLDQRSVYYTNVELKSSGQHYDGRFNALKLVYRNICHQAMFFPRRLLSKSPYADDLTIHADWAKNIELMASVAFVYSPYTVCRYNDMSGASYKNKERIFEKRKAALFREHHGGALGLLSQTAFLPTWFYHLWRKVR